MPTADKSIPTEMRDEARELEHEMEMELNPDAADGTQDVDDEFGNVGSREPKVCITTSRDPSSRLKQFAK